MLNDIQSLNIDDIFFTFLVLIPYKSISFNNWHESNRWDISSTLFGIPVNLTNLKELLE